MKNVFALFALFSLILFSNTFAQQTKNQKQTIDSALIMRRQMIHSRSSLVMPFNMNKVTHYFFDTKSGGVLKIKAKDSKDTSQVNLIREHLKKEHDLFSNGNFGDPKTLHGMNMPGLKTLKSSRDKYKFEYKVLSDGAQLSFISKDSVVINALHRWFAAQLRDHGSDAKNHE
ncbi:MAG: hypothetical protein WCE54_13085 [Ignavibacteriaceae bacterium]